MFKYLLIFQWTCVHDIQDYESEPEEEVSEDVYSDPPLPDMDASVSPPPISLPTSSANTPVSQQNIVPYVLLTSAIDSPLSPDSDASNEDINGSAEQTPEGSTSSDLFSTEERQTLANGYHPRRINVNGDLPNGHNAHFTDSDTTEESSSDEMFSNNLSIFSSRSLEILSMIGAYEFENGEMPLTFHRRLYSRFSLGQHERRRERLLYFKEELNVGRGFIKELCFSSDGRLVCSPFDFGVRLLSFDPECRELCDLVSPGPIRPLRMFEVKSCISHSSVVVTCKFSPQHCMLVSGCLSGKVVFHQPVL